MPCSFNSRLSAYHDGELDAAEHRQMQEHLLSCVACSAQLADLQSMSNLFAQTPRARLSQIGLYRLHAGADRAMQAGLLRIARFVQAVAACVLVAGSAWLMQLNGPASAAAPKAVAVKAAPPWVDVAVAVTAETRQLDTSTPAAAWYLADASSRGDEAP